MVIFLIDPCLEVILRLQKLFDISRASAFTVVGEGFEGAVGHDPFLHLGFEAVDLPLLVVQELL